MKEGGRIIQVGSSMVRCAAFLTASLLYTLTKGAITGFNRCSHVRSSGPRGITVNTVHPGPTDTDMKLWMAVRSRRSSAPRMADCRYGKPHGDWAASSPLASPAPEAAFCSWRRDHRGWLL